MTKTDCRRGSKDRRQTNERMEAVCRRGGGCISIRMEYSQRRWRVRLSHQLSFFLEEANEKNGSCEKKIRDGVDALLFVRMKHPNA